MAIQTIQYNARIFVQLQNWPWWRLFSLVKPLLAVNRVDESMRNLNKQLSELQVKFESQVAEKKILEESSQILQSKYDKLKRDLDASQERNIYLESLNHELEYIVKERESDISRLTGYLDRFCSVFNNLMPVETKDQIKE